MTKIIFVRHGQTEWNIAGKYQGQSDVELSSKGIEQAKCLAKAFPVKKLDAVYASDLKRAMVTAGIAVKKFQLPVQPEQAFREMDFGAWEGLTYAQIAAGWPEAIDNFFKRPDLLTVPDGETFVKLQDRAVTCVHELLRMHPDQTIAVFAHGAVLRTVLAAALHMPLRYLWSLRQDNTAVSIVRYEHDNTTVELLNSTAHLRYRVTTSQPAFG
jgi:alpha-ribazole phosphatase